ncbi:Hypothetical protein CINCED_3A005320 [Cinara cedri]|uniref:Uncharacterized protein n=1 Tax=Cinara cedri TaxID=506608 RepID=A0A5E4N474_9HEMI|nr:Hypothetical protein CINCED_3A005320 [Cinara cedri]
MSRPVEFRFGKKISPRTKLITSRNNASRPREVARKPSFERVTSGRTGNGHVRGVCAGTGDRHAIARRGSADPRRFINPTTARMSVAERVPCGGGGGGRGAEKKTGDGNNDNSMCTAALRGHGLSLKTRKRYAPQMGTRDYARRPSPGSDGAFRLPVSTRAPSGTSRSARRR